MSAPAQLVRELAFDPHAYMFARIPQGGFEDRVVERLDGRITDRPVYSAICRFPNKPLILLWEREKPHEASRWFHPLTGERMPQACVDRFFDLDGRLHRAYLLRFSQTGEENARKFAERARIAWIEELRRTAE
jgi:hypothetical protein